MDRGECGGQGGWWGDDHRVDFGCMPPGPIGRGIALGGATAANARGLVLTPLAEGRLTRRAG
ncbi:hypothetical protein [Saccharothrix xinjiangensis]|uniref:Uncharacterized protein n=1 Tax=Saccharothrix xinjiangensis TaxID=204798 RepID=A0ABV9Y5M8_9PSEU